MAARSLTPVGTTKVAGTRQLHPHAARPRTLTIPQGTVAALDTGTVPHGPTALLLPGYTGSKEDFAPILDGLASAGFRAVAIDLPGQYESPGPDDPAGYAVDTLAEVVQVIADTIDPSPIHLLGHSFGGLVARSAAIATPARWRSISLLDSGPGELGGPRRQRIDQLEPVLVEEGLDAVVKASEELDRALPGWQDPSRDLIELLRARLLASSAAGLIGMAQALRVETDRTAELRDAGVPALVAFGVHDDAWSTTSQQQMAERLASRTVVISDAAHSPALDRPQETVAALVSFWTDTDAEFAAQHSGTSAE